MFLLIFILYGTQFQKYTFFKEAKTILWTSVRLFDKTKALDGAQFLIHVSQN